MQVFFMGRLLGGSQVKATGTAPSLPAAGGGWIMNLLPASCVQKFLKHTGLAKWAGELILKLSISKQKSQERLNHSAIVI